MWRRIVSLQKWMSKNRLLIWWVVFIPVVLLILIFNYHGLIPNPADVHNTANTLQFKIFDSVLLIVLARIILVALGVVILLLCLLFPVLQVGKEGIQWNKELEEVLTEASSEIAGEEISELIAQEDWRWTLIRGWLRVRRPGDSSLKRPEAVPLIRDLLDTIWKVFPNHRLSLSISQKKQRWAITHPLLPQLAPQESTDILNTDMIIRLELNISQDLAMVLTIQTLEPTGFSKIDERFLLVLSEVFLEKANRADSFFDRIVENFELIPLTPEVGNVYDKSGGVENGGE